MKVNITLNDDLMKRVDEYADENYMSRSGLISFAVTQFLNQADAIKAMKGISLAIRKVADQGKIDDATRKELEDYERLINLVAAQQ